MGTLVQCGTDLAGGRANRGVYSTCLDSYSCLVLSSVLVQFHKVADKYLALSFRSEGEPYLSLTSLA